MKSRLSLIFAALVVLLGAMVRVVADRRAAAPVPVAIIAPAPGSPLLRASAPVMPAPVVMPAPLASAPVATPAAKAEPVVHVDPSGAVRYVARAGDTLSEVAVALLGSDSKDHRDAVAAVNVTLQDNPDRVLIGQTYSIDTSPGQAGAEAVPAAASAAAPLDAPAEAAAASPAAGPRLTYIARSGDTVAVLAGNLLGGDTAANRAAIIAANESLREYPSHLIAGKTYTIVVPDGMTSDPAAPQAKTSNAQPDADEAVQQGAARTLRYTANSGDTVSKLAVALLGSDTPANQKLIVQSNPTLKQDPDHLVAGRTYWISAPDAE
jgi:LysM repeat protein